MRVSHAEKAKTRDRIITSAARQLRERGVDGASVADVMAEAGHTHGGFYRHFDSKDDLVAAALDQAFEDILGSLPSAPEGEAVVKAFIGRYLSDAHVDRPGLGCPIPALAADIARAGPDLKAHFSSGEARVVDLLAPMEHGDEAQRRAGAWRRLAMMAGAVLLARASTPALAAEILAACRLAAEA